jgi:SET domain
MNILLRTLEKYMTFSLFILRDFHPIQLSFMHGYGVPYSSSQANLVNTRCVYYLHDELTAHHEDNMTLAPFIDMINHSSDENVNVSRVDDDLEIRAIRNIEANEEIVFSYHSASSRFWICEYGFCLKDNEYDDLDISFEIELLVAEKREWLKREGYWGYIPSEPTN